MPTICENASSDTPSLTADPQPNQSTPSELRPAPDRKAVVVGLYGLPGSGKTFLLNQLKQKLGQTLFAFYEGSEMIATVVDGGLDAFQSMEEREKAHWRQLAIDRIEKDCADSGQVAIVAGHFMFWSEDQEAGSPVCTKNDLETYTHILYLNTAPDIIVQHRLDDTERSRPPTSADHLRKWQKEEWTQLRDLCRHHHILFSLVSPSPTLLNKVSVLLQDFRNHNHDYNISRAESRLDDVVAASQGQLEIMLVMDADKTLAAEDTGALFWKMLTSSLSCSRPLDYATTTLNALFSSRLGYSYTAFCQAVLLYEEAACDQEFETLCEKVALAVTMDTALENAIDYDGLQAHQVLLPSKASPRLETTKLPIVKLADPELVNSLLGGRYTHGDLQFICATNKNAAKLLATRMRDSAIAGLDLREAHGRVGSYLANEFLADVTGLEECPIRHVQGGQTMGYRLFHEKQTTIAALMRGGEPMAFGVSEAFPLAMFVHAGKAEDITLDHLQGQLTIILVDSVINTGTTIVKFVQHVRSLHATIRIVVVAGVVQSECVSGGKISGGTLNQALARHANVHLIALRLSDTSFRGSGTTDTGNRLFNTTHLD